MGIVRAFSRGGVSGLLLVWCLLGSVGATCGQQPAGVQPAGVQIVDRETGRGIPLVELTTVDGVVWISDSGGWVAVNEPQLSGQTVYFGVRSAGYQVERDGFGMEGVRLQLGSGSRHRIELQRVQPAQIGRAHV